MKNSKKDKKENEISRRKFIKETTSSLLAASVLPGCALVGSKNAYRKFSSESDVYDYIVIGSGAGGGPVTARLVEAGFRVLLIEAGSDKVDETITTPVFHPLSTENPEISWDFFVNHYSKRSKRLINSKYNQTERGIFYPRASGLGGCTLHNAMITMYPDNSDWEHIIDVTGDKSWDPLEMRRLFQKLERNNYYKRPNIRNANLNREKMGFDGWLSTEQTSPSLLLKDKRFLKLFVGALKEEGIVNEISDILGPAKNIKLDSNTWSYVQNKLDGIFNVPKATYKGKRSSTRELLLNIKNRYPDRLTIQTNTLVSKIVMDDNNRVIGVEALEGEHLYKASPKYNPNRVGKKREFKVNKEVILSGGAYNSPQVLMLSGIGDEEQLSKFGIETKVNLPGVGKNLQDRYEITVVTETDQDFSSLKDCTFGKGYDPCMKKYMKNPSAEIYGSNGIVAGILKRSSFRKKDPDLFLFGVPGYFKGYYKGWSKDAFKSNYFTWAILKGHTGNSGGQVTLKSNSPVDTPNIHFRYFKEGNVDYKDDINSVLEGVNTVRRINSKMEGFAKKEVYPGKHILSDNKTMNWIENESWGHHASCTNKMGIKEDPMSVIDSKFRVHGTKGLRVVDASSFNRLPGLFIVTPIYMIAEKAAEDIINSSTDF